MSSFYLPYRNSRFFGIREGSGKDLLICLHGFGESAAYYVPIVPELADRYTVVALDMPVHGETEWKEGGPFRKEDLYAVIKMVLEREGFQRFSLMAYSMGGRLALCIVESLAALIDRLVLVAPDGLHNNPWHRFVTTTDIGNRLFRYVTYHPAPFLQLLILWKKLGWLNQSVYKFVLNRMDTEEKRALVYNVWTCMREMRPDKELCRSLLAKYNIPTLMIFGRYDRVIPPAMGEGFLNGMFPGKLLIMEKGHHLLTVELAVVVKKEIAVNNI